MKAANDRLVLSIISGVESKSASGLILVGTTEKLFKVISAGPDADQDLIGKIITVDTRELLIRKLPDGEFYVGKQADVLFVLDGDIAEANA
jgi:hypothetical protein